MIRIFPHDLGLGARNVKIYETAKLFAADKHIFAKIGHDVIIDDLVFAILGAGSSIGDFVHIGCHSSILGGGQFVMGDFSGLSAGVRIFTASDDLTEGALTNPTVPDKYRNTKRAPVTIGKHAVICANSVVMAGAEIGDGTIVGANSFVPAFAKLEAWHVYAGCPVRKVGTRPRDLVETKEAHLRMEFAA
jgi:galactoside O-acetyltransferase